MRALIVAGLCVTLLSGCGLIPTLPELIMRPTWNVKATPGDYGYEYQAVRVPVAPSREVAIWHIPSKESKALVVVVPGSSANKSYYSEAVPLFVDDGYDVILMDYEGYGESPGTPTLQNAADNTVAVTKYAFTLHDKVVLFGASLGSPSAVYAATEYRVVGLILESSLLLAQEPSLWLQKQNINVPLLADIANLYTAPQVPDAFNILKHIRQVDAPKLIMHSIDDTLTPFPSGQQVYDAASAPKTFWEMKYDHGQMIRQEPDVYAGKVRGWLNDTLGLPTISTRSFSTAVKELKVAASTQPAEE